MWSTIGYLINGLSIESNPTNESAEKTKTMLNNTGCVPETLSEIIGVAIEYDLHLEPNQFINFVDLYRKYLFTQRDRANSVARKNANFYQFICSQSLLDTAASAIELETGEPMIAPKAFQPRYDWESNVNLTPSIGLH